MDLSKPVQLCVCQDGTISFRERGTIDPAFPKALPFHSVDTLVDAAVILSQLTERRLAAAMTVRLYPGIWRGNVDDVMTLAKELNL